MSTATVTSKGQITIPADVRQALQVKAGDRVEFVQIEPGRFEVVAAHPAGDRPEGIVRPAEQGRFDRRYEQGDCGPRGICSMIGLDTNALIRYIMQDDAKQSAKANKLIESLSADKPGFIPLIAIVPTR